MYRYKCTAAVNADKQDFYDVKEQLQALYPELTENVGTRSDNEFLRREFSLGESRIMLEYCFSERSVTVYSEKRLEKYYEGRQITEGQFPLHGKATKGTMWAVSGVYSVVMAVVTIIAVIINSHEMASYLIIILAAAYTFSGFIIRQRKGIPLLKLIFCQAGGFISVCSMIVLANLVVLSIYLPYMWSVWLYLPALPLLMYAGVFLSIFFPALEISFLLQVAAVFIMKKRYSSKTVKGGDIGETDQTKSI